MIVPVSDILPVKDELQFSLFIIELSFLGPEICNQCVRCNPTGGAVPCVTPEPITVACRPERVNVLLNLTYRTGN